MKVCALIPAYQEAAHIVPVIERTRAVLPDVLVYDDGSTDGTPDLARAAGAEVLVHEVNQGKGATLADGLDACTARGFDAVVTLDGDGQHAPEEIPRFLEAIENADIVIGNRMTERATMPFVRWHTNRTMSRIVSWLAKVRIDDSQVGFRCIRCAAWKSFTVQTRNFDFESEQLVKAGRAGLRIVSVPISTIYGDEVSKINLWVDTIRFAKMVWRLWRERG